jgi:VanZ family protein
MRATVHGIRIAVIALACYWVIIFVLTHVPSNRLMSLIGYNDKLIHASAFAVLAFLLAWALPTNRARFHENVMLAGALGMLYAGFDELLQIPVGRTADWADFLADCIGITVGLVSYTSIRSYLYRARIHLLRDSESASFEKPL